MKSLSHLLLIYLLLLKVAAHAQDKHNFATFINTDKLLKIQPSYFDGRLLNYTHISISPEKQGKVVFDDNSFKVATIYFTTNRYIGLSIAIMQGDTVCVSYENKEDTYNFTGIRKNELKLYKDFSESKFSTRKLPSPLLYNGQPIADYIKSWQAFCNECENFIAKATAVSGIRPEVKAHFILEARLRLLQLLAQPLDKQTEESPKLPLFYRDTVLAYEQKIGILGDNRTVPSIAFAYREYASVVAASEGRVPTLPIQYEIAKREYAGYQREWTCYSVLKDMFVYNNNVEFLPALLKDYQGWVAADSPFLKRLLELTQNNGLAILSKADLNDELRTLAATPARLFDIMQQHKGQVLYVDMWASWCKPCIEELPASLALQEAYRAQPVAIVYLSIDVDQEKWLSAVANFLVPTTTNYRLHDEKQSGLVKRLQIKAIPRYLLIDKQGVLRYSNAPPPSAPGLHKLIDSLL